MDEVRQEQPRMRTACELTLSWKRFRAYGGGQSLEDSPWDTGKQLTGEESLNVLGKERDKDDCNHHNKLDVSQDLSFQRGLTAPRIVFL
jgi:hypothetical protein